MAEKTYREFDPWRVSPIREEKREEVLSTHYFDIDRVSLSSTEIGHFERYILRENDGDTICVLPVTDNEEVILIEQYRVPNHSWTLELPAGHATEQGQHPEDIAALKLEEEAGYRAQDYAQVVRFVNTPSFSTQHTIIYRATGLAEVRRGTLGPESPSSATRAIPLDKAYELALNGTIVDAKSIIGILNEYTRRHNTAA